MTNRTSPDLMFTLKAGDLAYIDSFSGLVPCKVQAVEAGPLHPYATVTVTATRAAYKRGDVIPFLNPHLMLVKRTQVFTRSGRQMIFGSVSLIPDNATPVIIQKGA